MSVAPHRAAQRSVRTVVSLLSSVAVAMTMIQLAADQDSARARRDQAAAPDAPAVRAPRS